MRVESWEKRVGRKEEAREDGGARLSAITSHSSRFCLLSALFLFLDKGGVGIPGRGGFALAALHGEFSLLLPLSHVAGSNYLRHAFNTSPLNVRVVSISLLSRSLDGVVYPNYPKESWNNYRNGGTITLKRVGTITLKRVGTITATEEQLP